MRKIIYTFVLIIPVIICLIFSSSSFAVNTTIVHHKTAADFLKGKASDVIIDSKGTLRLGRASQMLSDSLNDVWSINCIIVNGNTFFFGTSPNGEVYKYSLGKLTKIYPIEQQAVTTSNQPADANEPNKPRNIADSNTVEQKQHLINEHIFAMANDISGRLLVAVSGNKCRLLRLEAGNFETVFEPNDARYIFAIEVDTKGDIFLGTGPKGRIYKLDSLARKSEIIYESTDKNILSLAVDKDGLLYAGTDGRGLIYKINPDTKKAEVLYDSDQQEITSLLFGEDGLLYAAASSAQVAQPEIRFTVVQPPPTGKPETAANVSVEKSAQPNSTKKIEIPGTAKPQPAEVVQVQMQPKKPIKPPSTSYVYKISKDGFVSEVFAREFAIFFSMAAQANNILVATGNSGKLYSVDLPAERQAAIYDDQSATQITAVAISGKDILIGTANPPKFLKLTDAFASEGTYTSALVDAAQPAKWGKLQADAEIPQDCKILIACRSGNVSDINDPAFSTWTEPLELTEPVPLDCPVGRFCQYKLILQSKNGSQTPIVNEVTLASMVPNLAPKVDSVNVDKIAAPDKKGLFKIIWKASDENNDTLIYKIDFRKLGRTNWIEIKDKIEAENFEWDGRTVEDGKYEIKITASDERSNTEQTKLTGSRVSDPFIVDNTGPEIVKYSLDVNPDKTAKLEVVAFDKLSIIAKLEYSIDSNTDWIGAIPKDLVYDSSTEEFAIVTTKLKPGEHVIALKIADASGNITYKTFDVNIPAD